MSAMADSFSQVEGLLLRTNVIDQAFQRELASWVDESLEAGRAGKLRGSTYTPVPPHFLRRHQSREMLQFGVYTHSNRIEYGAQVEGLPPILERLIAKLRGTGVIEEAEPPDTCVVSSYQQDHWLPFHRDHPGFERPFFIVSLLSEQSFLLRAVGDSVAQSESETKPGSAVGQPSIETDGQTLIRLPVGSALRLDGDAADRYEHAVPAVTARRVSITLRRRTLETISKMEQHVVVRNLADQERYARKSARKAEKKERRRLAKEKARREREQSISAASASRKTEGAAVGGTKSYPLPASLRSEMGRAPTSSALPRIERDHVQAVYNSVATAWHGTRYKAWPRVESFVRRQRDDHAVLAPLILDLGCGNGKNLPAVSAIGGYGVGLDFSHSLCGIAASRGFEIGVADAVALLPVRKGTFDAALCIAVLHHISSEERRVRLVSECMGALRVGGEALFYAWAMEQEKGDGSLDAEKGISGHRFAEQDVLVPYHVKGSAERSVEPEHTPKGRWDPEKQAHVYERYCHVYTRGELRSLFTPLETWVEVREEWWDTGNWAVVARRIK